MRAAAAFLLGFSLVGSMWLGCSGPEKRVAQSGIDAGPAAAPTPVVKKSGDVSLVLLAELQGTIEPCGCTSDPLGYLDRTALLLEEARKERPTALLDGGSTLYPKPPVAADAMAQDELEAEFVAAVLGDLELAAAALGASDVAYGKDKARIPRQAANVTGSDVPTEKPRILDLGGVRVGVFGVVDPDALAPHGVTAGPPEEAAREAIGSLRAQGAQMVVALAHMPRQKARKLVRDVQGIDLLLVGHDVPELGAAPETIGTTHLVTPGSKGQVVVRVDAHVDAAGGPFIDAIGPERAAEEAARTSAKIDRLKADLARWEKDPSADPAFVNTNRDELARLERELEDLRARPMRAPDEGSWLTIRSIPVKKKLACDPEIVAGKTELDRKIGEKNLALFKDEKPPAVPSGGAGYVGVDECVYCHKDAVEFWRTTRHHQAWDTLEAGNKHLNRECVSCHLTGWLEPGGATLVGNELLRDVQCETCHGPGSLHVDADGKERPKSLVLAPAEDLCATRCHTPEHSDTFEWTAYMRDVVGKGHGEKLRKKLGKGPTGRELRGAALEKAGRELGAGCRK
jgi:hypothetical protein